MNLKLTYPNQVIEIKLLDNLVVRDWAANFNHNTDWASHAWGPSTPGTNPIKKEDARNWLIYVIKDFNACFVNSSFPFTVNSDTEFSNEDLNFIHRTFVSATSHRSWLPTNNQLEIDNYDLWYEKLAQINNAVHKLQIFCNHERKAETADVTIIDISSTSPSEYIHRVGDWKYLDYHLECDVFIQHVICGKDTYQAYVDYDSCHHADVMAAWTSLYNAFYIDMNGGRNEMMKRPEFKTWLTDGRKMYTAWQYMPLGHVVSGNIQSTKLGKIIKVELE
jgi:hypothetical protein